MGVLSDVAKGSGERRTDEKDRGEINAENAGHITRVGYGHAETKPPRLKIRPGRWEA